MLSAEACLADMRDKTGGKTACRKDWDVANESIRAANWGGQPESPVLWITQLPHIKQRKLMGTQSPLSISLILTLFVQ